MALRELSTILWRERELMEAARRPAKASRKVRARRLAQPLAEVDRAVVVHGLAERLDLESDVSLRRLADELPKPWADLFKRHHAARTAYPLALIPRALADFLR